MVSATATLERPAPPGGVGELVELVHETMKRSVQLLHPALTEEGVTMGQFWALHTVSSLEAASVSSIARYLGVSPPTACASVDQLEASGLVVRHRSTSDRRSVRLALTARGRRTEARLWQRIGRLMSEAAAGLPDGDVATSVRVFRAIQRRLELAARPGRGTA